MDVHYRLSPLAQGDSKTPISQQSKSTEILGSYLHADDVNNCPPVLMKIKKKSKKKFFLKVPDVTIKCCNQKDIQRFFDQILEIISQELVVKEEAGRPLKKILNLQAS